MIDDEELKIWFLKEVLPREPALTRYIWRNCKTASEVVDIRQDIYTLALEGARNELPQNVGGWLHTIARNQLINRSRRARIVMFDQMVDFDEFSESQFLLEPQLEARSELRRMQAGLKELSPQTRKVVCLRKIEGLSVMETAELLGITQHTVKQHLKMGMRALAHFMSGKSGRVDWAAYGGARRRGRKS